MSTAWSAGAGMDKHAPSREQLSPAWFCCGMQSSSARGGFDACSCALERMGMLLGRIPQPTTERETAARLTITPPREGLSFKDRPEDRDLSAASGISACLEFKALGDAV